MLIIRLSFPHKSLMPNRRLGQHWTKAHAAKVKARDDAFYATKEAMGPAKTAHSPFSGTDGYIPLSVLFVTPTRVRRDWDGMAGAFKAQQDGIALALGIDDSRFKPVLIDWVAGDKPGAVIVGVGVTINQLHRDVL